MIGGSVLNRILMNLGFEAKYDAFEERLKAAGFQVVRTGERLPAQIIECGKGCQAAVINAEDQWTKETMEGLKAVSYTHLTLPTIA